MCVRRGRGENEELGVSGGQTMMHLKLSDYCFLCIKSSDVNVH